MHSQEAQSANHLKLPQSLKETFAAKIPGEIEKIKKLKKYVNVNAAQLS